MIETARLQLRLSTPEEMESMIENEKTEELKQAYREMLEGYTAHPDEKEYWGVWKIERKEDGKAVGDLCFKGLNSDGSTEIGYGIYEGFSGMGYATEAVHAVCLWALGQPGVVRVEAETAPDNIASQRVLEKNGFEGNRVMGEEGPRFSLTEKRKRKKLLWVDGAMRKDSRSRRLAKEYLDALTSAGEWKIERVRVAELDLFPMTGEQTEKRSEEIKAGGAASEKYAPARQFAEADRILISAPYWDCLCPAKCKTYLEHISVSGITFAYHPDGSIRRLCRADRLIYITAAGGKIPTDSAIERYVGELAGLYGIPSRSFFAAEMLDVFPERVEELLEDVGRQLRNLT